MTAPLAIVRLDQLPPKAQKLAEDIDRVCNGHQVPDVCNALFAVYVEAMLAGCDDFAMFMNNVDAVTGAMELNARRHFKRMT